MALAIQEIPLQMENGAGSMKTRRIKQRDPGSYLPSKLWSSDDIQRDSSFGRVIFLASCLRNLKKETKNK